MLQSMRDKAKSWVTFVVVGIIAFMMAITGLETLAPNPNNPEVASVNGKEITRAELAQAVDQQRRALVQQMGDQFDPAMLDDKLLQDSVLSALIDRQLLLQDAQDHKMEVGQAQLDQLILSMPQFQQDGRFNKDRFQMMVRSYGMTPLQFRDALREEGLMMQLRSGIASTEFVISRELNRLQALEGQTRDLAWVILDSASVRKGIVPSDEEIQSYYDGHNDRFMTPEQVVVSYVELNKADLAKGIAVTEDEVAAEYEQRIGQLKQEAAAKATVSAILIETGSKRSLEEARTRAEEVVAKLKAGGQFADLARSYSDDPISLEKGGDLGEVQPGFFGDEFDQAVASLKVGQVSEPVETGFGLQILKVTRRDEVKLPTLETLRPEIEMALKQGEVDTLFLDQSRQLADISFESSDLAQPAEQLGLKIQTTAPFGRTGGEGIASDRRVATAAFSDDVLGLGANSELIELTPDRAVVVRVKEHRQPELMKIAEVRDQIINTLKYERAEEQLKAKADELTAQLKSGINMKNLASEQDLKLVESSKTGRNQPGAPAQLLQKAFKMPHPGKTVAYDHAVLPNGDLALIALSAIYPGEAKSGSEQLRGLGQFIANSNGRNLFDEYLRSIKASSKVEMHLKDE